MLVNAPFLSIAALAASGSGAPVLAPRIDTPLVERERQALALLTLQTQDSAPGVSQPPPQSPEETGTPPSPAEAQAAEPAPADLTQTPALHGPAADEAAADASPAAEADEALLDGRRRPGVQEQLPDRVVQENDGAVRPPPPEAFPVDQIPVPDRWRLIESLGVVKQRWFDPYNQNFYKGDRPIDIAKKPSWLPIKGNDWFFVVNAVSDTIVEPRSFPTPVNRQLNAQPGDTDVFGRSKSLVAAQTFIGGVALIKGSTAFKPPDVEYRLTLAYNVNYVNVQERRVLNVRPSRDTDRLDDFLGIQELFVDKHLRNVSDRFDFDSIRIGIQPFQADFRGFLFNDNQLGVRYFGNRDNNRYQYNAAVFWRLEKDTNSGLNDITQTPRDDFVFFANLYAQDFPFTGLTSQVSATLNINRERELKVDDNGFPVRPALLGTLRGREYDVLYLGYSNDGRIGRMNLTTSLYAALGEDRESFFTGKTAKIRAFFGAAEASYDVNWMRFRLSGLYASGDGKPYNNTESGFDAIFENPVFAGADTSYWIRQTLPFAGGGRVISIQGRNGILNSLRSSKEQGQSNFNNPGTMLVGAGADFDVLPEFRISANANHLWFENTATLEALRTEGSIPKAIGFDLSAAAIYRPSFVQNAVFRLSAAMLEPSKGFRDLFTQAGQKKNDRFYSILFNGILSF